jgi:metal-responsive CopG/Arc/MetJ family transcriptional regulator
MYTHGMKRLQIYIEEELDEALAARAMREGTSRAALIRRYVADQLRGSERKEDSLDALVGALDADPSGVDDVVYGQRSG